LNGRRERQRLAGADREAGTASSGRYPEEYGIGSAILDYFSEFEARGLKDLQLSKSVGVKQGVRKHTIEVKKGAQVERMK
jgi:hypothetical protein